MVLCLLSRGSRGNTGKLNHEETVRGPEIAIFTEKSEILLLLLVNILKKSGSAHSSSDWENPQITTNTTVISLRKYFTPRMLRNPPPRILEND